MNTTEITPQAEAKTATWPMDIINSTGWYITLPTPRGVHGSPDTVNEPKLATYSDDFFYLNATKDGAVFKAPTDGATTKNSPNPRSELREMSPDGKKEASWTSTSGTHSMEIEQAVNALPLGSKPVVVTGQIHDAGDDVTVFRVEANRYEGNTGDKALCSIWITDGDATHGHLVTNSYRLGDRYRVGFQVANGKINYTFNGQPVAYSQTKKFSGAYFKAGSYCQSGGVITKLTVGPDAGKADYAEVTIYSVQVCHDGVCTGGNQHEDNDMLMPVITVSATSGMVPLTISFDGSASTPKDSITTYSWDFGDAGTGVTTGPDTKISHTYAKAGEYTAKLTIGNAKGATASNSIRISALPKADGPTAVIKSDIQNGPAPLSVKFDGSKSTPAGTITAYNWDFGDSTSNDNTATGAKPSHTYAKAGLYTVTLTVTGAKAVTGKATIGISAEQKVENPEYIAAYANLPSTKYAKPTRFKAKMTQGPGSATVTLSWTAPAGEANATVIGYKIYEKTGSGSYTYILATTALQVSLTKAVGSYRYQVSAVYRKQDGSFVESPKPSSVAVSVK